jgi:hypothetical protein
MLLYEKDDKEKKLIPSALTNRINIKFDKKINHIFLNTL